MSALSGDLAEPSINLHSTCPQNCHRLVMISIAVENTIQQPKKIKIVKNKRYDFHLIENDPSRPQELDHVTQPRVGIHSNEVSARSLCSIFGNAPKASMIRPVLTAF